MVAEPSRQPDLSIVVPARNEEENLPILLREITTTLCSDGVSFELLVVDDGSQDKSREWIRRAVESGAPVRGLLLSRNFGHQAAVSTGLQHARGRAVAVMDADLQDRPADLLTLYRTLITEGVDVVYAVRQSRKEGFFLRLAYRGYYRLLARLASIGMPLDAGDFCVMSRRFVSWLNDLPERERYVRGLRAWLGGSQIALPVARDARRAGTPQYTLSKLIRLALDGVISFSFVPLRLSSIAGAGAAGLAFLGLIVVAVWKAMGLLPSGAGLGAIALSVLFLGGVQLLTIGILGEYVGRVFNEVKQRPVAVVAEVVERGFSE